MFCDSEILVSVGLVHTGSKQYVSMGVEGLCLDCRQSLLWGHSYSMGLGLHASVVSLSTQPLLQMLLMIISYIRRDNGVACLYPNHFPRDNSVTSETLLHTSEILTSG